MKLIILILTFTGFQSHIPYVRACDATTAITLSSSAPILYPFGSTLTLDILTSPTETIEIPKTYFETASDCPITSFQMKTFTSSSLM